MSSSITVNDTTYTGIITNNTNGKLIAVIDNKMTYDVEIPKHLARINNIIETDDIIYNGLLPGIHYEDDIESIYAAIMIAPNETEIMFGGSYQSIYSLFKSLDGTIYVVGIHGGNNVGVYVHDLKLFFNYNASINN